MIDRPLARPILVGAALCHALAAATLAGCVASGPAPVVDRVPQARTEPPAKSGPSASAPRATDARPAYYTVRRGDTLFSIALDHGVDYRELAQWNGITNPASVRAGQQLRLTAPASGAATAPLQSAPGVVARPITEAGTAATATGQAGAASVKTQPQAVRVPYSDEAYAQLAGLKPAPQVSTGPESKPGGPAPDAGDFHFAWPARGKLVGTFDGSSSKGVAIGGKSGQPVYASAAGKVIYSGVGIRGMGKFIVIRHSDELLSVYAHNSELIARYGDVVKQGQKIAEMGNSDADQVKLYFEIRRYGKPVDPLKLLPPPGG